MSVLCAFCVVSGSQEAGRHYNIGIALTGSKPTCPIFVMSVRKNSPAAQAGIKAGDRLTTVDGNTVKTLQDAVQRLTSNSPGAVTLQMMREDVPYSVTVQREEFTALLRKNDLRKLPNGALVSADATEAEIKHFLSMISAGGECERPFNRFSWPLPSKQRTLLSGLRGFHLG